MYRHILALVATLPFLLTTTLHAEPLFQLTHMSSYTSQKDVPDDIDKRFERLHRKNRGIYGMYECPANIRGLTYEYRDGLTQHFYYYENRLVFVRSYTSNADVWVKSIRPDGTVSVYAAKTAAALHTVKTSIFRTYNEELDIFKTLEGCTAVTDEFVTYSLLARVSKLEYTGIGFFCPRYHKRDGGIQAGSYLGCPPRQDHD